MRTVIAVLFMLSCTAYSQVPRSISYQGLLTDAQGNLVPDGNHQLSLKLFDRAEDGNQLFTETHTVAVVNGLFNAIIGSVNPLPPTLAFDRAYFLAVSVDGGSDLAPRTPLTAVPYALRAAVADALSPTASGAVTSINNQSGAITLQGAGGTTVTNNGSTITVSSTGSGGNGIQGVQSSDGSLTITNPNGPVASLSIAPNAVNSSRVADGSITATDIAPGVIPSASNFLANGSTAGGDLTGSYPDPLISANAVSTTKLADNAVTSQKIASLQVVKSLNNLKDEVTLAAGANITITPSGNALIIGNAIGSAVQNIQNSNNTLDIQNGDGPFTTINLKAGAVGTTFLADGAVTAAKLAPGVIPAALPPSGNAGGDLSGVYPNPSIAGNAVTSAKILDGSIGTADLADASVNSSKIVDGSVATVDLADNSVTAAKMNGAGATNGQVLTFSSNDVVWQTPTGVSGSGVANRLAFWNGTGSLTSDANYTVTTGNSGSVAMGLQCTASGNNSVSLGAQCSASGPNTIAIGAGAIASANGACAFGVSATASGVRSHAIGNFVTASNGGSVVMGDNNTTTLTSSASNQLSMRFVGGYRLFSNSAFTTGVTMAAGVSGWTNICDRNLKEHVAGVDGEKLLARLRQLPISEWSYRNADPSIRYIGPMAQDFHAAFHLGGTDSLGINSIIADGVNMAAAKALEKRTRELQAKIRVQEKTIETLYGILESVNRRLAHLERDVRDDTNSETEPVSSTQGKSSTMPPASDATTVNSAKVVGSESSATAASESPAKVASRKR